MDFKKLKSLNWKRFWRRLTFIVSIGLSIIGFCMMFSETYSSEYPIGSLGSAFAKGLLVALFWFGYVWALGFAVYGIIWVLSWIIAGLKKD